VAATHTHAAGAETQATEANAHAHTIDGHIAADYGATEKAAIDLLDDADGGLADIHTVVNDLHTDVADVHTDVGAAITAIGDVHATDLPAVMSMLTDIHGTDLPAVKSDVAAILADTGTDGVVLANDAITAAKIAAGAIDNATFAADVGSTAYATNIIALAADKAIANAALATATNLADLHTDVGTAITNIADVPTNAELATALGTAGDAVLAAVAVLKDFDPATDVVAHVTLVDTTTMNTDMVAAAPAASAVADAVWDEAIAGHAGAGSTGAALSAATAPSAATIADAVWDEAIAGHAGAGSAGAALAAAGSAGDPWSTLIPGAYGAGTAGKILGDNINAPIGTVDTVVDAIKAKTDTIGSGTVTAVSPVAAGGAVSIIAGDSYDADDGRELSWTGTTWPSLVGATVVMKVTGASYACTVTGAGTASQTVVCELTKVQTAALAVITHSMDVEATLASGNLVTLVRSTMTVAGAGA
jgi:hypothetical protein